jgi:hypothetical protein
MRWVSRDCSASRKTVIPALGPAAADRDGISEREASGGEQDDRGNSQFQLQPRRHGYATMTLRTPVFGAQSLI